MTLGLVLLVLAAAAYAALLLMATAKSACWLGWHDPARLRFLWSVGGRYAFTCDDCRRMIEVTRDPLTGEYVRRSWKP
jgi:hypothetical protein